MAAIGWFGPLIDLSKASSHIGDYVQLLVLVHKFTPVQYKLLNGGEVVRTDIQVGDDTRPFFSVSIWQKQMGSTIVAGSVILLQNVKVTRFGDVVEARTVQHSSIQCLVHTYDSLFSKGADNFIEDCHVGITTKAKLKKVVLWVRRAGPTLSNVRIQSYKKKQSSTNWKVHEETPSQYFFSLSDVLLITNSCKATFFASVGEIFLPITWKNFSESEDERMFIRRRLYAIGDNYLAEDFICSGCQHCGVPLNSELGFNIKQGTNPLYCQKSSNHHHLVSLIYRPFQLYVWDESQYIPLLVTNKAAELLFGNISAESVYSRYNREKHCQMLDSKIIHITAQPNDAERESTNLHPSNGDKSAEETQKYDNDQNRNTYLIWLILLKTLLQRGRNNPLKFRVRVDATKDWESGRFELVSLSIPCCSTIDSSSLIKETPRNVDAPSNSRNAL